MRTGEQSLKLELRRHRADGGAPFGAGTALTDDDSSTGTDDLTGYTIVDAADLDAARALTDGHPYLSEGTGRFSIEIFELAAM